eukprot:scaffold168958_cov27-Tisochrysis_lutea.AAC.2
MDAPYPMRQLCTITGTDACFTMPRASTRARRVITKPWGTETHHVRDVWCTTCRSVARSLSAYVTFQLLGSSGKKRGAYPACKHSRTISSRQIADDVQMVGQLSASSPIAR